MAHFLRLLRRFERQRGFWRRVDVGGREECWPWRGSYDRDPDRRAWELVRGPLPDGVQLAHRCGNDTCVNPDHMELVRPASATVQTAAPPRAG